LPAGFPKPFALAAVVERKTHLLHRGTSRRPRAPTTHPRAARNKLSPGGNPTLFQKFRPHFALEIRLRQYPPASTRKISDLTVGTARLLRIEIARKT
jgi:hypothetical protein